jgi:hypothetical protein
LGQITPWLFDDLILWFTSAVIEFDRSRKRVIKVTGRLPLFPNKRFKDVIGNPADRSDWQGEDEMAARLRDTQRDTQVFGLIPDFIEDPNPRWGEDVIHHHANVVIVHYSGARVVQDFHDGPFYREGRVLRDLGIQQVDEQLRGGDASE